jgi:hypothetical protein
MKQKHLYSLLDTTYTPPAAPAAPPQGKRPGLGAYATESVPPWGQPSAQRYEGQSYTYKVPKDADVKVGDYVVTYGERRGLCIARVVRVDEQPQIDVDASFDYKWVVQKVDREGYEMRVKAESAFGDAIMQIERVKQRESMLKGFQDNLGEGTEARKLFDQTVQNVGVVVDHKPA